MRTMLAMSTTTEEQTMSRMHNPAHPGKVLREFLPRDLPVGEVASRLGVSRQALSALLNGRAGVSAEMWVQMQANHDLWQARQLGRPKVRRIAA